ncbi:MAG: hypothetical protein ABW224_05750 [Kibdelosporangium sp.]
MISSSYSGNGGERLAQARATHAVDELAQQAKAVRTVASQANDPQDRAMLMEMLGLDTACAKENPQLYFGRLN